MYIIQCINFDKYTNTNWITKEKFFKSKTLATIYKVIHSPFNDRITLKKG